jgi:hypothetical protein
MGTPKDDKEPEAPKKSFNFADMFDEHGNFKH